MSRLIARLIPGTPEDEEMRLFNQVMAVFPDCRQLPDHNGMLSLSFENDTLVNYYGSQGWCWEALSPEMQLWLSLNASDAYTLTEDP